MATLGAAVRTYPDLTYSVQAGRELKLDVYAPLRQGQEKRPALVYFHGGGWVSGHRHIAALRLLPYLQRGWVGLTVSYRLAQDAPAPAALEDARCAYLWLQHHAADYGVDPAAVVLAGGSAGGLLALEAAMAPPGGQLDQACGDHEGDIWRSAPVTRVRPLAVVNWFGITDLGSLCDGRHDRGFALSWSRGRCREPQWAAALSPLPSAVAGGVPVITVHGIHDDVVPFEQAERLHARLETLGVRNQLVPMQTGTHGGFEPRELALAQRRIFEFLDGLQR